MNDNNDTDNPGKKAGLQPSFLNDLAARMAAGPPKKPVGLLKKSNVMERAEQEAADAAAAKAQTQSKPEAVTESQEESMAKAKASLADILNQSVSKEGPTD